MDKKKLSIYMKFIFQNNNKKYYYKIRKNFTLFILLILILLVLNYNYKYKQDDLTLVTAYYRIKSKHSKEKYLKWINNIVLLNKSIVFFTNKEFIPILKKIRPNSLHDKSVFNIVEMEDFYSYKKFYKEFNQSFQIDIENKYQTVPLYLIWAEKCMFLKRAILHNYFKSKCFYWIDAGYFREDRKDMQIYLNGWPSTKKCLEDKRILMGFVRKFSYEEKRQIVNFDLNAHKNLQRSPNVASGMFGGQAKNSLKFINYYYRALRLFIKKKIFIGKEQNVFTYVAFAHKKIIKLVFCNYYLKKYLS